VTRIEQGIHSRASCASGSARTWSRPSPGRRSESSSAARPQPARSAVTGIASMVPASMRAHAEELSYLAGTGKSRAGAGGLEQAWDAHPWPSQPARRDGVERARIGAAGESAAALAAAAGTPGERALGPRQLQPAVAFWKLWRAARHRPRCGQKATASSRSCCRRSR